MLVIAAVLGSFAFIADARLQTAVLIAGWPFVAKVVHYLAPWCAVASAFGAGGLCANSLGERAFNFLTRRNVVASLLVVTIFVILIASSAVMALIKEAARL